MSANHVAKHKKEKYGPPTISLPELRTLLEKYKEVNIAAYSPFCVYDIPHDVDIFRFFFTSKALIEKARGVKLLCADATYKLLWQGFPVLIIGTTDMEKKFHVIGVAVCSNEKQEDFEFLFRSVKKCAEALGEEIAPMTLVCDGSKSIQNAFKSVFGDQSTIIMCWAHMVKNVVQKAKTLICMSNLMCHKKKQQKMRCQFPELRLITLA